MAEPSQIQDLLVNVQNISAKADAVLTRADKLFADSGPAFADTIKNIDVFSKSLNDASSGLAGAVTGIGEIGRKIGPLAQRLEKLSDDGDKLLNAIDVAKVRKSVSDLNAFTASLGDKDGPTQRALGDAATLVKHLNETAAKLDAGLADMDAVAKAFDAKKVSALMDGAGADRPDLERQSRQSRQDAEGRRRHRRQARRRRRQGPGPDDQRARFARLAWTPRARFDRVGDAAKSIQRALPTR